jgi:hypothetical protein
MSTPRARRTIISFVDQYCALGQDFFPDIWSFDPTVRTPHVMFMHNMPPRGAPRVAPVVGAARAPGGRRPLARGGIAGGGHSRTGTPRGPGECGPVVGEAVRPCRRRGARAASTRTPTVMPLRRAMSRAGGVRVREVATTRGAGSNRLPRAAVAALERRPAGPGGARAVIPGGGRPPGHPTAGRRAPHGPRAPGATSRGVGVC